MTDKPRIISTEKDLEYAREMETRDELDAMAATIRALWKERDALTNLGCKAVDLTTEISEGAGKEIAELRAMVDTKIEDVVTFCRGEADAVFIKTPHSVPLGTIDRIGKALREKLGEDTLVIILEGDASVEALGEETMRERGWVRSRNPFPEYPREIVCNGCCSVVAFGPSTLLDDTPIIAANLIRPDGKQPRDRDPLCLNCGESSMGIFRLTGGGPFTVRDRGRTCLHCGGSGIGLADSGDVNAPPCVCCGGDGKIDAGGFHTVRNFPTCDGSGHVPGELTDVQRKAAHDGADPTASPVHCPTCHGTGKDPENFDTSPCPTCKGTGADDGHVNDGAPNPVACSACDGTGRITLPVEPGGPVDRVVTNCPTCWGSGTDAPAKDRPCPDCNGRGRQSAQADRDAMVPPCPTCKGTGKIPKEAPND